MTTTTKLSTELLAYYRQISTEIFTVVDQNMDDRLSIICLCDGMYPEMNRHSFIQIQLQKNNLYWRIQYYHDRIITSIMFL
jgi:hypothetical protein